MLKVALIGFGGIAQAHKNGYATMEKLGKARLVAVCDIRKAAFERTVEINLKTENKSTGMAFQCYLCAVIFTSRNLSKNAGAWLQCSL